MKMIIPDDIKEFRSLFDEAGKELFLVGGCVRDFLLGNEPKDFDMATDAFPEEIERILSGYRMDLTGKQFGVMRVYTDSEPKGYEIATYREDETVGRKPKVKIGSTMRNDSMRRDFTINALYLDISTANVIDLVGGVEDIKNRIVRTNGRPEDRMREDALRIMRAVRFKHAIGGEFSEDLSIAIMNNPALEGPDDAGNIVPISQERIAEEFLKGLQKAHDKKLYIRDLIEFQLLGQIFRGLDVNFPSLPEEGRPEVYIARILLLNNNLKLIKERLVQWCKFSAKMADGICFLLSMYELEPSTAYRLRKSMKKTNIDMQTVLEFSKFLPPLRTQFAIAFTQYEITADGESIKAELDIKDGPELGKIIEQRELESFIKIHEKLIK